MGHPQLATDTSRVRRWIDMGEIPRDPVPRGAGGSVHRASRPCRDHRGPRVWSGTGVRGNGRAPGVRKHPDGVPWAPERTAAVLTEFTGMDLMLNRRGLVGAGAALAAGSALSSAMHDWLHTDPALAADAPDLDDPLHADPAGFDRYEAAPIGSQEIEALERSVEVFRAWDAARGGGLQRKAVVGQLNEVGGMLAYRHPDHLQRRLWGVAANLAVLAGWMSHDVGLEPTAQKYFVIAAHAAREGGDRPRAGRGALPGGPPDGAPGPARRRARPDEARQVRFGRGDPAAHPGDAATPSRPGHRRRWGAARRCGARSGEAEDLFVSDKGDVPPPSWMQMFDEADLHGMQALAYRTLAEHDPAAAVHRPAPRQAGPGAAGRRPSAVEDLRLHLAGLRVLHRRRPRTGRPLRAAGPGVDGLELLAPHLGPAARDVPAHRPVLRAIRRSRNCARRSNWRCRSR